MSATNKINDEVIYDNIHMLEKSILARVDLNPKDFYIGGAHLSACGKSVELDIYESNDRYYTDMYLPVSEIMEAA